MKISIKEKTGELLLERHLNFEQLILQAQSNSESDPIKAASDDLISQFSEQGIAIDSGETLVLRKKLSEIAYSGNEETSLNLIGKKSLREKKKAKSGVDNPMENTELFEKVMTYPNPSCREVYAALVGLDAVKDRLLKEAILLTVPSTLHAWSKKNHKGVILAAVKTVEQRSPFLIFAGDVGTGKTALAENFGEAIADSTGQPVKLFRLSIMTRGGGIVGEMTKLITASFKAAETEANTHAGPTILLLDEADALAQSREEAQMHHEDRAGVNALIQGIDRIRTNAKTMLVIFCTNRLSAIDPAIRRRAADIFEFERPNVEQRKMLFEQYFSELKFKPEEMDELVSLTGPVKGRKYGFSFSDIVNKLIPNAVFASYPDKPLSYEILKKVTIETLPTEPFKEK